MPLKEHTRKELRMEAKLTPPECGKNWSVHFLGLTEQVRNKILSAFHRMAYNHESMFKKANPFLQGDSDGWMMIEFWTDNQNSIIDACLELENTLNICIEHA